jgi:hypothetical protein
VIDRDRIGVEGIEELLPSRLKFSIRMWPDLA